MKAFLAILVVTGLAAAFFIFHTSGVASAKPANASTISAAKTALLNQPTLPKYLKDFKPIYVATPKWYLEQISPSGSVPQATAVTYKVETRGEIGSSLEDFKRLSAEILTDERGWAQLGIEFVESAINPQFTLVLSQASLLPSFSSGCSSDWSCRAGSSVIINDDRWSGATDPWNAAGKSLQDYRRLTVNHEVGHWLGHDHAYCSDPGVLASVMQQQSMELAGCKFNPWPLRSELWTTR